MDSLSRDPIINAINNGIRRAIDVVIANECFAAAVVLIFAGIDAMANLNRPDASDFSAPEDFRRWVATYFCLEGETQVTPEEWWAARNAVVHTFGAYSKAHRTPGVRVLGWMVGSRPYVRHNPRVEPDLVLVDILGMREAFFAGINRFLIEAFAARPAIMEQRIGDLFVQLNVDESGSAEPREPPAATNPR
jgi:hypothetical protein